MNNTSQDISVNISSDENETIPANNSVVLDYNSTQGKYINATGYYADRYIDEGVKVIVILNETKNNDTQENQQNFYEDRYKETD